MGFYLVAHQTHTPPTPCSAAPTLHLRSVAQAQSLSTDLLLLPPLALRLGPKDQSGSPSTASSDRGTVPGLASAAPPPASR